MTDKYKGIVEMEIAGSKRGFKFGTRAMMIFCELDKVAFKDVDERLKEPSIETQLNFYLSGAIAYAKLMRTDEPTIDDVAAWIDEVGYKRMEEESAKSMEIPNEAAPEMGQMKVGT